MLISASTSSVSFIPNTVGRRQSSALTMQAQRSGGKVYKEYPNKNLYNATAVGQDRELPLQSKFSIRIRQAR